MRPARPSGSRSTACSAATATACPSTGATASGTARRLSSSRQAPARYAKQGYTAIKLRLGHEKSPAREVRRVMAVREAVGPDVRILVDATETWDLATALDTGFALQEAGIHWLEDPIATDNVAGLARLCSQLRVRIATGEHLYKRDRFPPAVRGARDGNRADRSGPHRRHHAVAPRGGAGARLRHTRLRPRAARSARPPRVGRSQRLPDRERAAQRGHTEGHAGRGERLPRRAAASRAGAGVERGSGAAIHLHRCRTLTSERISA